MPVHAGGGGLVSTGGGDSSPPRDTAAPSGREPMVTLLGLGEAMPPSPGRAHFLQRAHRVAVAVRVAQINHEPLSDVDPRAVEWLDEIANSSRNDAGWPAPVKEAARQVLDRYESQR